MPRKAQIKEITPDMLQNVSFEIIGNVLREWRQPTIMFRTNNAKVRWRIRTAVLLHAMVIDAIKVHEDIRDLQKLHKIVEEIQKQFAIVKKIHPILGRSDTDD